MNAHAAFPQPRQFERGFTTDYSSIQYFLAKHGWDLFSVHANRMTASYRLVPVSRTEKPRKVKWSEVIDHVDTIRTSLGLEPIRRRK